MRERARTRTGLGLALACSFLFGCAEGLSPPGNIGFPPLQMRGRELVLPSGARLVFEHQPGAPVAAVVTYLGVGSTQDPPGKEGLAHLCEHLTYRARADGRLPVMRFLEAIGASQINGATSWNSTEYHAVVPIASLPRMLQVEASRILRPLIDVDDATFLVEREVVRNELRQRNETGAYGQIFAWLQQAAFPPGHVLARSAIGTHESLSAITLEDARRFVEVHYRAENATIVVTGAVDRRSSEDYRAG